MSMTASVTEPIQGGQCPRCRGVAGPPPLPLLLRADRRSKPGRDDEGPSFAELINVSDKSARRLISDGVVESVLIRTKGKDGVEHKSGRRMVFRASVDDYLLRLKNGELR